MGHRKSLLQVVLRQIECTFQLLPIIKESAFLPTVINAVKFYDVCTFLFILSLIE